MKHAHLALTLGVAIAISGCGNDQGPAAPEIASSNTAAAEVSFEPKPASESTQRVQQQIAAALPEDDGKDLEFATRGFIGTLEDPVIKKDDGEVIMDLARYDFVRGEAPDTVNPSLWRHVEVLAKHGLFQVAEGVFQIRGLDPANMTIVEGDTGWVIIDPLYTTQSSAKALELLNRHLGERPVSAVLYTHSHADHSGGVRSLISEADAVPILAPDKLIEETLSEFVLAGNSMGRRVSYQFGAGLEPGPQGKMSGGILTDTSAQGTVSFIEPTDYIKATGETRTIDGVRLEFQMVPETEAPAEMNVYLPDSRVLYVSEFASCTMHNLQTPRGALVRNALSWAGYITEALDSFGDRSDAMIQGHCWPRFGSDEVKRQLRLQRDMYKFIHDHTLRRLNNGETALEIADDLQFPPEIEQAWSTNPYYGTLKHNVKGVYQWYVGWWDGNPAHLDLLPPVEQGRRYVDAIGGPDSVLEVADNAMAQGDYRWSAQLLNHLVFSQPDNDLARAKLADSLEQLGYQAESAIWRNYYLVGAKELRRQKAPIHPQDAPDVIRIMPVDYMLKLVAARINPEKVGDLNLAINLEVSDTGETYLVTLRNAVVVHRPGVASDSPDIRIKGAKLQLMALLLNQTPVDQLTPGGLTVEGDIESLKTLQSSVESPVSDFNIIEP
jgi:linear primary-alkylsulfatase